MDENTIFDKVHDIDLKKTMENSYIDYALSLPELFQMCVTV